MVYPPNPSPATISTPIRSEDTHLEDYMISYARVDSFSWVRC